MKQFFFGLLSLLIVSSLFAWKTGGTPVSQAQAPKPDEPPKPGTPPAPPAKTKGAEAGIKAITAEYAKAFNAGDAKAAASLWTENGEYAGADNEVITGRENIEKSLAEFFKEHPKAIADIRIESVKFMGSGLATAIGVVALKVPGNDPVIETKYSALHVLEDGVWRTASVREWVPDPSTEVTPQALEFLVGEWKAKGPGGLMKIVFTWDETKTFLTCKYTITNQEKPVSSGTQIIGRNPAGGLRSWSFDSSGTTSEAFWTRDETRWISESTGILPDGTEITSVNILIPLGADKFTWQTTERSIDGVAVHALPPIKVTRVKNN